MCWSTKKYTKFRKEHEIKYRNFDEMQLETEEFNLKEQLMEANYNNNTIYYNIGLAYFAALLVLPQILDEKGIDPIDLGAVKNNYGGYNLYRIIFIANNKRNIYTY